MKFFKTLGYATIVSATALMLNAFVQINTVGYVKYIEPNTPIAFAELCLFAFGFVFAISLLIKNIKRGDKE